MSELDWAGGLFEGEGNIALARGRYLQLYLKMTDEDSVRRFHAAVRFGSVNGPYTHERWKPWWVWQSCRLEHTQQVLIWLWPGLGSRRREKARDVMTHVRGGGD